MIEFYTNTGELTEIGERFMGACHGVKRVLDQEAQFAHFDAELIDDRFARFTGWAIIGDNKRDLFFDIDLLDDGGRYGLS